jgi:hypothetical protein
MRLTGIRSAPDGDTLCSRFYHFRALRAGSQRTQNLSRPEATAAYRHRHRPRPAGFTHYRQALDQSLPGSR